MKEVVIISAVRTPVGRYMGALKNIEAYDLAAMVLNSAVERAHISPDQVDEVIMGQSYQNGEYVNIARMALLQAGWPDHIPGVTLDRRCCTGLEVVRYAASLIRSNEAEIVLAGGVESMSNTEFYLPGRIKWGVGGHGGMPKGHGDVSMWGLPFFDRIQRARVMSQPQARYGVLPSMMSWAETAAKEEDISRESCAVVGGDPKRAYQTVPLAVKKALDVSQVTLDQIGRIEIQEAFAAQVLADIKTMGIGDDDHGKINVNGSGISLGHPIACTGTRVLVTLLYEMKRGDVEFGLATICGGGGLGIASILKKRQ